jgi:hypothetical protein
MTLQTARCKETAPAPITRADRKALDRLVDMVKDRKDKPFCGDLSRFEEELKERLQEVGRELVADELAKADINVPALRVGGVEYRRVLQGAVGTYMTSFGEVSVERTLYKDRSDPLERALAVLEPRVGVIGGFWTPQAAKQAEWVVAQMVPGLAEELFARVGTMQPSKSSLDRLPKEVSDRWEDNRQELEQALRGALVVPPDAHSAAVSLDGVLVPMRTEAGCPEAELSELEKTGGGPEGYREVGCATISFYDEAGQMLSAIRLARMPETRKATLKEAILAELGVMYEQRPDLQYVKVADAAKDNWTFLSSKIRVGKEAVDYYHATEHLDEALKAGYGDGTGDHRRRYAELADVLLTEPDGVDRVIATLRYLRRLHPKSAVLKRELKFFKKNRRRMQYASLRAEFLPVGSGPMEAACKTLATQRMKQSGQRWGMEGGQAILTPRAWSQSGRFDQAWALIAAKYQVQVTLMSNVVDLTEHRNRAKKPSG